MKKIAIILALVLILSISLTFTSVCFAWYIMAPSDLYYEVADTNGLQTYAYYNDAYVKSIIIPYTYFFKVTATAADGYIKISYNGRDDLYISENTPQNATRSTTYKDCQTAFYKMDLAAPSSALQLYEFNFTKAGEPQSNITQLDFVGYALNEDAYYFLVNVTITIGSNTLAPVTYYVKAADVTSSEFNPGLIDSNPASSKAKDEKEAHDYQVAQNKLRRNIFFIAICTVCVVVVLLIYNPFKKKQPKKANPNMTSDDDF